jgi:hypothetical protein
LPLRLALPGIDAILDAARMKAKARLSYADAFAVGLALSLNGSLVTGDPEIRTAGLVPDRIGASAAASATTTSVPPLAAGAHRESPSPPGHAAGGPQGRSPPRTPPPPALQGRARQIGVCRDPVASPNRCGEIGLPPDVTSPGVRWDTCGRIRRRDLVQLLRRWPPATSIGPAPCHRHHPQSSGSILAQIHGRPRTCRSHSVPGRDPT